MGLTTTGELGIRKDVYKRQALCSVLSLGYYAPLVNRMYRREPGALVAKGRAIPAAMLAPLVVLALAVVILGVLPFLAGWLTIPAAADLLAAFAP